MTDTRWQQLVDDTLSRYAGGNHHGVLLTLLKEHHDFKTALEQYRCNASDRAIKQILARGIEELGYVRN